jgi:hypothetical protein
MYKNLIKSYIKEIIKESSLIGDYFSGDLLHQKYKTDISDKIKDKFSFYNQSIKELEEKIENAYDSNLPQEEIDRLEKEYEDLVSRAEDELMPYIEDMDFSEDREQDEEHYSVDYYSLDRELYELYERYMNKIPPYTYGYDEEELAGLIKGIIDDYRYYLSSRDEINSLPDYKSMTNDELIEFMTDAYHAHKARLDKKRNKTK